MPTAQNSLACQAPGLDVGLDSESLRDKEASVQKLEASVYKAPPGLESIDAGTQTHCGDDVGHLNRVCPMPDEIPKPCFKGSATRPTTDCNSMPKTAQIPGAGEASPGSFTTAMIRNIACKIDKTFLAECLDSHGLAGMYDGIYVPTNPARGANLGYAFVNFKTADGVELCKDRLTGCVLGDSMTKKTCEVTLACVQGTVSHSRSRRRGGAWRRQTDKKENTWSL